MPKLNENQIKARTEFIKRCKFTEKIMVERIMKADPFMFSHMEMAMENGQQDWERDISNRISKSELKQGRFYVEATWEQFSN